MKSFKVFFFFVVVSIYFSLNFETNTKNKKSFSLFKQKKNKVKQHKHFLVLQDTLTRIG